MDITITSENYIGRGRMNLDRFRFAGLSKTKGALIMKQLLLVTASTLALVSAAAAADLPTRQPPPLTPVVGKAPIGKAPIGKAPIGKAPIVTKG